MRRRTRSATRLSATTASETTPLPEGAGDCHTRGDAKPVGDQVALIDTVVAGPGDLPSDDTPAAAAGPPAPAVPHAPRKRHRKTRNRTSSRRASPRNSSKPPGRHRKLPDAGKTQAIRRAQVIGLPLLGLPAIILLLIVTVAPSGDDTAATSKTAPPTTATNYPMPSLNPNGPATGDGRQVPTDALANAAAAPNPGADPDLVTLAGSDRQIPAPMLAAYQQAATTLTGEQPSCHLRWQLLAGIGKVESGNAQGRQISPDGNVTPTILGPRLTGTAGYARITDTDHGTLDTDTTYDRAVGPLQFLPSTWTSTGRDANNDGHKNPNNIHDAALTAATYLCAHHRDLTNPTQLTAAIRAYNPSDAYVRAVLAWTTGYTTTTPVAAPATPAPTQPANDPQPSDPPPVFTFTPVTTTPAATPTTRCDPIDVRTDGLTATLTPTTLDITGHHTTPTTNPTPPATTQITALTIARDPTGKTLTETARTLPLTPDDQPTLLAQLPLNQLVDPGHTTTATLTLTITTPGCPAHSSTTLTITNITQPATPTPTTTTATISPTPTSSPTPTPTPSPTATPTNP